MTFSLIFLFIGQGCLWSILQKGPCKKTIVGKKCFDWCWEVHDLEGNFTNRIPFVELDVLVFLSLSLSLCMFDHLVNSVWCFSSKPSAVVSSRINLKECLRYEFFPWKYFKTVQIFQLLHFIFNLILEIPMSLQNVCLIFKSLLSHWQICGAL